MRKGKKKGLIVLFLALTIVGMVFAGGQAEEQGATSEGPSEEYEDITFFTGAAGGLYMEPAVIWASQMQAEIPELDVSPVSGGGFTNPLEVTNAAPNTVIGITDTNTAADAIEGAGRYAERVPDGIKNLKGLWRFNVLSYSHVLARPEAIPEGVTTLGELLEQKPNLDIALKLRGSLDEILAGRLFNSYGYSYEDLEEMGCRVSFNNPSDIANLMIDGHADLTVAIVRTPASYILDMEASIRGLKWLEIEQSIIDDLVDTYGYMEATHPTEPYSSLDKEIASVAVDHFVFVHEDMDEELAYKITKAVMEDPEKVKSITALKPFDASVVWKNTGFPLHEGAERAFRELGYME